MPFLLYFQLLSLCIAQRHFIASLTLFDCHGRREVGTLSFGHAVLLFLQCDVLRHRFRSSLRCHFSPFLFGVVTQARKLSECIVLDKKQKGKVNKLAIVCRSGDAGAGSCLHPSFLTVCCTRTLNAPRQVHYCHKKEVTKTNLIGN